MNARATELASPQTGLAASPAPAERLSHRVLRGVLRWPGLVLDGLDALLRPARPDPSAVPQRLPSPVHVHTPEAYLGLQPGLRHHREGSDWAAFRLEGGTALIVGGVQAPPERRVQALRDTVSATTSCGARRQVLYPVRPADLDDARQAGFKTVQVGLEAWIDLADFSLKGKSWAHLRQMRNRATKRGVHAEETLAGPWNDAMRAVWDRWTEAKQPRWALRWLTGTPSLDDPRDRRYFVAHAAGRLQAFCTVLPGPEGTCSVDVLCRAPDAIPGSMERLLVHALQVLAAEGMRSVSLGPCPLAHVPDLTSTPNRWHTPLFRWAWGSRLGDQLMGFQGLHAFKAKFQPRMEPVYLGAAPRIGPVELYAAARLWALSA